MMTTITITRDLVKQLGSFAERIEFRDDRGQLVGCYLPAEPRYVNPIDGSPLTEEELQELAEQPLDGIEGRQLEEILRDLNARDEG
jgi:hypothetical protein